MWKWFLLSAVVFSASAQAETKVLALSGSSREDSVNKKLVTEAAAFAKQAGAKVTIVDLKDYAMPFYDGDLEANEGMPAKAKEFRQLFLDSDVILIASPEYNGSLTAVLKNAIDWASRDGQGGGSRDAFKNKKFVLMSASPGSTGGSRGLEHLRAILGNLQGNVVVEQITVPDAYSAFDEQGHLKNTKLADQLKQLVQTATR